MDGDMWRLWFTKLLLVAALLLLTVTARARSEDGDSLSEEVRPARLERDLQGVTTVLLVSARPGKSAPPVGVLTKTARTFVQDGASTEFATQVLGTTLDNGRLYARILSTSSRVFYEKEPSPDPPSPYVVYPSRAPEDDWQLRVALDNTHIKAIEEIDTPKESENDEFEDNHENGEDSAKSATKLDELSRENDIFSKREFLPENQRFKPAKVRPDNLPTYTVKQEYVTSSFDAFEEDQPKSFRPRLPKIFKSQTKAPPLRKLDSKPLATVTYHGFADFTTTVGDTVIVFSPSTSPAPIGRPATTIKGDATLRPDDGPAIIKIRPTTVAAGQEKTKQTTMGQSDQSNFNRGTEDALLDVINRGNIQPSVTEDVEVESSSVSTEPLLLIPSAETETLKPTGLLKVVDSTTSLDGTTTHYKSLIYGTYIGTNYAQIIHTSSNVYFFPDEATVTYDAEDTTTEYSSTPTEPDEVDQDTTLGTTTGTTPRIITTSEEVPVDNELTTPYRDTTDSVLTTLKDILESARRVLGTTESALPTLDDEIPNDIVPLDPQGRSIKGNSGLNNPVQEDNRKDHRFESNDDKDRVSLTSRLLPSTVYKTFTYFTTFFIPTDNNQISTSIRSREVVSSEVTYLTELILPTATEAPILPTAVTEPLITKTTPSSLPQEEEEQTTKQDEEIELIFKTLYTTYTYLTTFFQENTSSVSSREVVETNVITQTVGPNGVSVVVADLFGKDEPVVISPTKVSDTILPTTIQTDDVPNDVTQQSPTTLENTTEDSLTTLEEQDTTINQNTPTEAGITGDEFEGSVTDLEPSPTPALPSQAVKEQVKTYYTTYTYFTTIFVDDETEIETRTEVFSNVVTETIQPTTAIPVTQETTVPTTPQPEPAAKPAVPPEILAYLEALQRQKSQEEALHLAKKVQEQTVEETEETTTEGRTDSTTEYPTTLEERTTPQIPLDELEMNVQVTPNPPLEGEVLGSMITDVVSSTSSGGGTVLDVMDKRNAVPEDQELSESNHHDVEPAPTLLLQTSYTTFTYFTTMYKGDESTVASRLETVTNVVTETIRPTAVVAAETSTLPVTYFTTFTYWTTFYKGGDTVTTSREETISNVVTPGVSPTPTVELGVVMTYRPNDEGLEEVATSDKETKVTADNEVTPSDIIEPQKSTSEEPETTSPLPAIVIAPSEESTINSPTIAPEPTTYYTTFTYFTTSYIGNETILNSRLETVTSVSVGDGATTQLATGRAIGGPVYPAVQTLSTAEKTVTPSKVSEAPKTGLISTIRSSQVNDGTTTHYTTDVYGTYIDGLYAQVVESSTRVETPPLLTSSLATPVLPTGVLSLNKGSVIDADEITTVYFTTRQIGTLFDGLYAKVIESTSSTKVDEEKKASIAPTQGHRTGLVRLIQGQIENNGTTTFYQSKVIGTSIEGRYAQIIESTSSFLASTPTANISPTSTLPPTKPTGIPEISPSPAVIQSSLSEDPTTESPDQEEDGEQSEEDEEEGDEGEDGQISKKKSRLTFSSRKRTFTPVIRPFASRNRPTFNPKRKGAQGATTITRTDITPTITATLAGKGNRFASSRGRVTSPIGPYSSTLSPAGSRRFSGRRGSQSSTSAYSSTIAGSTRGRAQTRISPSSVYQGNRRGGPSSIRGSSARAAVRGSSSIYPAGSSRYRPAIRPSSTLLRGQTSARHDDQENDANEFTTTTLVTEETPYTEDTDGGETVTTPLQTTTEYPRRSTNPLLRFRRPLNYNGATKATTTPKPTSTTSRRSGNLSRQSSPTVPRVTSTRTNNRLTTPISTRPRQSNTGLFPPRGLFGRKPEQPADEQPEDEFDGEDEENLEDDPVEEIADNDYEGSEHEDRTTVTSVNRRSGKAIRPSVQIRPYAGYGRARRTKRQATQLRQLTANRFRRPNLPGSPKADEKSEPVDTTATKEDSSKSPSKPISRYNNRARALASSSTLSKSNTNNEKTSAESSEVSSQAKSRTRSKSNGDRSSSSRIKPSPTSGNSRQFTLREKDGSSTSRSSYKRPSTSGSRPSSTSRNKSTENGRVRPPRLRTTPSKSDTPQNPRRTPSSSRTTPRSRTSSRRGSSTRGRGSHENIRESPTIHPDFDGTITVTHYVPTEVTIPVVNNGVTEHRNIITAQPSTEVLGPSQYSTVTGGDGRPLVVIVSEVTGTNMQGQTEITRFLLHETPTTRISHTLTTLGGRRASQSVIVPTTVYSVENIVSTIQPTLPGNAPLANILLSQLLLGQLGQANPLLQAQQTPTTQYNTRTTSYVTTITKHQSTVIPLTFRGKEILTTLVDSSTDVVTATEFITDTVIVTPTAAIPAANLNSLLLLLQQPQAQQQNANPLLDPLFAAAPFTQSNTLPGEVERRHQPADSDYKQDSYEYSEEDDEMEDYRKSSRPRSGRGKTNEKKEDHSSSKAESSVVTLYVSGRRPGEFSTVLSTVKIGESASRRRRDASDNMVEVQASIPPSLHAAQESIAVLASSEDTPDTHAPTQSLESVVDEHYDDSIASYKGERNNPGRAWHPLDDKSPYERRISPDDNDDYYSVEEDEEEEEVEEEEAPRKRVRIRVPVVRKNGKQHKLTVVRRRPLPPRTQHLPPVISTPRRVVVTRIRTLGLANSITIGDTPDIDVQPEIARHKVTITRRRKIQPTVSPTVSPTPTMKKRVRITRKKLIAVRPVEPTPSFAIITTGFYTAPTNDYDDQDYTEEEDEKQIDPTTVTPDLEETPNVIDSKPIVVETGTETATPREMGTTSSIEESSVEEPVIITDNFFFPASEDEDDWDYDDEYSDAPSSTEDPGETSKEEEKPVVTTIKSPKDEDDAVSNNYDTTTLSVKHETTTTENIDTTTADESSEQGTTGTPLSEDDKPDEVLMTTIQPEESITDKEKYTTTESISNHPTEEHVIPTDNPPIEQIELPDEEEQKMDDSVEISKEEEITTTGPEESTTISEDTTLSHTTEHSVSTEPGSDVQDESTESMDVINESDSIQTTTEPTALNVEEEIEKPSTEIVEDVEIRVETEVPETEAPETEAPVTESPKTEAPKTEAPKTEAPKTEAPKTEAPKTEAPKTEAPKTEAPKTEAPKIESKDDVLTVQPIEPNIDVNARSFPSIFEPVETAVVEIAPSFASVLPLETSRSSSDETISSNNIDESDVPSVIPLGEEYTTAPNMRSQAPELEASTSTAKVTTSITSPTPEEIEAGLADDLYLSLSRPDFPEILPSKPIILEPQTRPTPDLDLEPTTSVYYTETVVTSTRLRTYTYVVTQLNGHETKVTSSTTVRPRVTTLTLTVPVTVTVTPTVESPVITSVSSVYSPVSAIGEHEIKDDEGRRFNLATRVMSNGVEVIVAGPTPALRWENSMPQQTLTLSDTVVMMLPQGKPNEFVTKTCTTTFTYLSTITRDGTTTVSTEQQVVANTATEERHRKPGAETAAVTLEASPTLRTEVFKTTYTYLTLNTDHPNVNDALESSTKVITNTVTAPQHYLDMILEPSEAPRPETNTYFSTRVLEKTFMDEGRTRIETTSDTVTQLIVTESAPPPRPTSVTTTLTALDNTEGIMTDVMKTYYITYTYYNTFLEKGSTVVRTNVATSTDVVLEKVPVKKTTTKTTLVNPTPEPIQIFATKTYLTTFTYFTTLLQAGPDGETSTTVSSRSHIVENVITESIAPSLLDAGYMNALLTTAHHSDPVKNVVTGSTIIFFDEEDQIDPSTTSSSPEPTVSVEMQKDEAAPANLVSPTSTETSSVSVEPNSKPLEQVNQQDASINGTTDAIKDKRPTQNGELQVSNLLSLGSLGINGLSALGPVITAMAGLLQGKTTASRRNDTVLPVESQEVTTQRSPIYIPVADFADGDIETAESQHIGAHLANLNHNYIAETRHKVSASLADGIPISPGEVITANSDVIIGKPGKMAPRPPQTFVKDEEHIGMKPPPMPVPNIPVHPVLEVLEPEHAESQTQSTIQIHKGHQIQILPAHQVYEEHLKIPVSIPLDGNSQLGLKQPQKLLPVQSVPSKRIVAKQDILENDPLLIPPERPNVEQYANPNTEKFRRPWSAKDPLNLPPPPPPRFEQKIHSVKPSLDKSRLPSSSEEQKRPIWAQKDPLMPDASLSSQDSKSASGEPVVHQVPHVIDRSTGEPLLVNIQPSQVANVVIPQGGTQALIFGDTSEPHISGQYFDDPSPYPEPEVGLGFVGIQRVENLPQYSNGNDPSEFMVPPSPPANYKPADKSTPLSRPSTIPLPPVRFDYSRPQDKVERFEKKPSEVHLIKRPGGTGALSGQGHVHTEILVQHRPESVNIRPQSMPHPPVVAHPQPTLHLPSRGPLNKKPNESVSPPRRTEVQPPPEVPPHRYIFLGKPDSGNEITLNTNWKSDKKPPRITLNNRPRPRPIPRPTTNRPIYVERPTNYPARKPIYSGPQRPPPKPQTTFILPHRPPTNTQFHRDPPRKSTPAPVGISTDTERPSHFGHHTQVDLQDRPPHFYPEKTIPANVAESQTQRNEDHVPTGAIEYHNPSNPNKNKPDDNTYYSHVSTHRPQIQTFGHIRPDSEEPEVWHSNTQTEKTLPDSDIGASEYVKYQDQQGHGSEVSETEGTMQENSGSQNSNVTSNMKNPYLSAVNTIVVKPVEASQEFTYGQKDKKYAWGNQDQTFGHKNESPPTANVQYTPDHHNSKPYDVPMMQGKPFGVYDGEIDVGASYGYKRKDARPDYEIVQGMPSTYYGDKKPSFHRNHDEKISTQKPYERDDTIDLKPPAIVPQFVPEPERPGRPYPRPNTANRPENRPILYARPDVITKPPNNFDVRPEFSAKRPIETRPNSFGNQSGNHGIILNVSQEKPNKADSLNVESQKVKNEMEQLNLRNNTSAHQGQSYAHFSTETGHPKVPSSKHNPVTRVHPEYPHILTKPKPQVPGPITISTGNAKPDSPKRPNIRFSMPVEAIGEEIDSKTQTERPPSMLITKNTSNNKKNDESLETAYQTNFATSDAQESESNVHENKAKPRPVDANKNMLSSVEGMGVPSRDMMPPPLKPTTGLNQGTKSEDDDLKPPPLPSRDVVGLSPPPLDITTTSNPIEDRFSLENLDESGLKPPPQYIPMKESTVAPLPSVSMVPPSPRPSLARPFLVELLSQDMVPPAPVLKTTRPIEIATVRPAVAVSGSIQIATAVATSHIPVVQDMESKIPIIHGTVDLPVVVDVPEILRPVETRMTEHVSIYTVRPFDTKPVSRISVQPTAMQSSSIVIPTKLRQPQVDQIQPSKSSSTDQNVVPSKSHYPEIPNNRVKWPEHPVFLESSYDNVSPTARVEATESLSVVPSTSQKGEQESTVSKDVKETLQTMEPSKKKNTLPTTVSKVDNSMTKAQTTTGKNVATTDRQNESTVKITKSNIPSVNRDVKSGGIPTTTMKPKEITRFRTSTVTRTETSVLGSPPTTRTLLLTHTKTSTTIETVTETLVRPTSVISTVTSTILQSIVTRIPSSYENVVDNDSIFVVLSDQNPPALGAEEVEAEYGEEDISRDEQDPAGNEIHRVLGGSILGAPVVSIQPVKNQCAPECRASKAEICAEVASEMRCICRPGFARMFPDRPCKPTYTYTLRVGLDRIGHEPVKYENPMNDTTSTMYRKIIGPTKEALDRTLMQSDLRDVYRGLKVAGFMPDPTKVEFHVQLSDNANETRLKEVLRKYLVGSNYSLGGTEVYASKNLDLIDAIDFDECENQEGGPHHDCSPHAACFNLRGSYQCSCKEGWADLSENPAYPGRICSQAPLGCPSCNNKGHCVTNTLGQEVCECFPWHSGQRCQVNLKVLLIALVTTGAILLGLLTVCVGMACFRHPSRRRRTGDRRAMIPGTGGDTSSEGSVTDLAIPHHVPHVLPPPPQMIAPLPPSKRPARKISGKPRQPPRKATMVPAAVPVSDEQRDRSLTVMIPRAKYRSAPQSPQNFKAGMSTFATEENKLINYLDNGSHTPANRKQSICSTKDCKETEVQVIRPPTTPTGALVSAGFQVSATVTRTMDIESTLARSCGETTVETATKVLRTNDLQADMCSTLARSCGETTIQAPTKLLRLDLAEAGSTLARSCGETTIQPPTKVAATRRNSVKDSRDNRDTRDSASEGHTMAERDLGSTLRLPAQHPPLYSPDRTSDRESNFDSL